MRLNRSSSCTYIFIFKENDLIDFVESPDDNEVAATIEDYLQERYLTGANEYALTPREAEVLLLLAKGRSGASIQEELCLPKGTVATHLRHICQKMGVHDKQELLDTVEQRAV